MSGEGAKEESKTEFEKMPEIVIPPDIASDIKEWAERTKKTLRQENFDLIVIYQRKGSLFRPLLEKIQAQEGNSCPIAEIHLGKETVARFRGETKTDDEPLDVQLGAFYPWLRNPNNTEINNTVKDLQEKVLPPPPKRILTIDDSVFAGDTSLIVGPAVLEMAFGKVKTEHKAVFPYQKSEWLNEVIKSSFGENLSPLANFFYTELAIGYVEKPKLKKIKDINDLKKVVEKSIQLTNLFLQSKKEDEITQEQADSFLQLQIERYGIVQLSELNEKITKSISLLLS